MSILKAYVMPHPPLAVPEVGRGKESGIAKTIEAMNKAGAEIAALKPETIVFITPHGTVYSDYFHISPGERAVGGFARFGAAEARFEAEYDTEFVAEVSRLAADIPAGTKGERDPALDHGCTVPMYYINLHYPGYKAVRISLSGLDRAEHYRLGQMISSAADKLGRRTVVIASGDLSHKLASDGPYGFAPEGSDFDRALMKYLGDGDFAAMLEMDAEYRNKAAECGYGSFVMLAGCFDRKQVTANRLSYEGPFGVGYGVVSFAPGQADTERALLKKFEEKRLAQLEEIRANEDAYRALARQSLESRLRTGRLMPVPVGLPDEMLSRRAGAFVSLHKNGVLRGCIGTIAPTKDCIAMEIIQNAVSAGLSDDRFPQVSLSELPFLTYKVDILDEPEVIPGAEALDVKKYGVIVESGHKRGLLLPNLDGVDTVEQQIDIARKKAGIHKHEPVVLKRFKVTRYG